MDTNALKRFAQEARRQLLSQVCVRLEQVLRSDSVEVREKEIVVSKLRDQIREKSKDQVVEEAAYTWFNRFCALRFMDVNGYTFTGIVSPAAGRTQPEILSQAKQGLFNENLNIDKKRVVELLNGMAVSTNPQQEAYRMLLKAACSAYHRQLPFLFADIEDYTELLMPEDLLSQNSILQRIREVLTEESCRDVEVIGWLYQFYISEKKNEVMGRKGAVPSEDIPAVTQLFTPHWIVRYLVENSIGRLWMLNHPESRLVEHMEYYIKPDQPEEEYIKISSPEEIKVCDPACGSGHMLTYAFDLLSEIYEEQGYDAIKIPGFIIKNNLYGVEIDDRAGQLAAFALMMKACEKDAVFFERGIEPNICVMENISFSEGEIKVYMDKVGGDLFTQDLWFGLQQFKDAKTFGSLIRPQIKNPDFIWEKLKANGVFENLFLYKTNYKVQKTLEMAEYLSQRYQVVVTNPPYFSKGMSMDYRKFATENFIDTKSDTFAMFIERGFELVLNLGFSALVTMQSWMFLASFTKMRKKMLNSVTIKCLVQMGNMVMGIAFGTSATVWEKSYQPSYKGQFSFVELSDLNENDFPKAFPVKNKRLSWASSLDFISIPGNPIAYWVSRRFREIFSKGVNLSKIGDARQGLATSDNKRFLRYWYEISLKKICFNAKNHKEAELSDKKWFPYNKGGEFRKWYGNCEYLINWKNDGEELLSYASSLYHSPTRTIKSISEYFKECISWSKITSGNLAMRYFPQGFIFDVAGCSIFCKNSKDLYLLLGFMNSNLARSLLSAISPTINFEVGHISQLPIISTNFDKDNINRIEKLIFIEKEDWDSKELSWDFSISPLLIKKKENVDLHLEENKVTSKFSLSLAYKVLSDFWDHTIRETVLSENQNNQAFIKTYGLENEITPEIPIEEVTLLCNPFYRYRSNKNVNEYNSLLLKDTMKEFISYGVGCMLGRYSLDREGLILANTGEMLQDYLRQIPEPSFMPDEDNVIPILGGEWFGDDIVARFNEFLKVSFGEEYFMENLDFLENAICKDLRSYFLKDFYTEHIKMYKRRPIYWMFSSPNGAFNALIYMHRYTPDTVSIVLNGYLRPFIEKLTAYKNHQKQISVRSDSDQRQRIKAEKEIASIDRMLNELKEYEEEVLFPLAAKKIEIDLDDGVLVNYKKFGKALKYVKGLSD